MPETKLPRFGELQTPVARCHCSKPNSRRLRLRRAHLSPLRSTNVAFSSQFSSLLVSGNGLDFPDESFIAICCGKSPPRTANICRNSHHGGRSATNCSQDAAGELHAHIPTRLLYQTDLRHDSRFSDTPPEAPRNHGPNQSSTTQFDRQQA